jgi:hypothetical protein
VSYALREKRQPKAVAKNLAILPLLQKIGANTTMLKLSFKVAAAVLALSLPVKGDPFGLIDGLSNDTAQPFLKEHVPNAFALRLDTIDGKGKSKYGSSSNPLVMEVKEAAHYAGLVSSDMFNPKTGIYGYSHPEPAPGLNSTTWPGPTIVARSYQKLYVKWENKILPGPHIIRPLNNTSTTGAADVVDTTLHWAYSLPKALVNGTNYTYTDYSIASNGTPIVPHLHGGHTGTSIRGTAD